MNYQTLFLALIIGGFFSFTSCSKCHECKAPIEVRTPDTTYTEYQSQELCTADNKELEAKEAEGYICN